MESEIEFSSFELSFLNVLPTCLKQTSKDSRNALSSTTLNCPWDGEKLFCRSYEEESASATCPGGQVTLLSHRT